MKGSVMGQQDEVSLSDSTVGILLANHRQFLSFLQKRVGSQQEAEEILQNAYVRSLEKSDQIRDTENVVAWFYRLLRNAIVDKYRKDDAARRSLVSLYQQTLALPTHPDPETERVLCECVKGLLSTLKPEQASLINLVDMQGNDIATVTESLGISRGAARIRLHRARAALRKQLERTCRTCATHGCLDCTCQRRASDLETT